MLSNFSISFKGSYSWSANGVLSFQNHKPLREEGKAPFAVGYKLALANSFFFSSEFLHQYNSGLEWVQVAQKVYLLPKESR